MPSDIVGNGYYVVTTLLESLSMAAHMDDNTGAQLEGGPQMHEGLNRTNRNSKSRIFLKLENTQPTQSFKLRGISNLMLQEYENGADGFVASSGGNAGMAAAFVAKKLDLPLKVFVPISIKQATVDKLTNMGATLEIVDGQWELVDRKAREESERTNRPYIHPFDHILLWEGHASMIRESSEQMEGVKPDLVVVSVGGGGLLMGVAKGMDEVGWGSIPILAMETEGTSSFNQSLAAGRLITQDKITGIATSLGATRVTSELLEVAKKRKIFSRVVTDKECVQAISQFLDEYLMLVEPACAASLCSIYSGVIRKMRQERLITSCSNRGLNILIIVCGGKVVSPEQLLIWKEEFSVK